MKLFDYFRKKRAKNRMAVGAMVDGWYTGGDGLSIENAVIVHANTTAVGIHAEYAYISQKLGPRGLAWEPETQSLISDGNRHYDIIEIKMKNGEQLTYYFDISYFFGKI